MHTDVYNLFSQTYTIQKWIDKSFRDILCDYYISNEQWRIVATLAESESEMSVGELTDSLGIHMPSISRMVKQLETNGFVSKRTSFADQRQVDVSLTPKGKRLYKKVHPLINECCKDIYKALGAQNVYDMGEVATRILLRLN